jgi:hypothetical protein
MIENQLSGNLIVTKKPVILGSHKVSPYYCVCAIVSPSPLPANETEQLRLK